MQRDPIHRKFHHYRLTFRGLYAFSENFVLALSHDEVVHLKGSLIAKMPGDDWQKAANLRALYAYMWTQSGKKLLFMGSEFGQWGEWDHDSSLSWDQAESEFHASIARCVADLNRIYREEPALHTFDADPAGFEWIDADDSQASAISYLRRAPDAPPIVVACNFTPIPRENYRVGVPLRGHWREIMNTDATVYGGSGVGNMGGVNTTPVPVHGRPHSINLTLPPLSVLVLRHEPQA
jgi:1,4-alpha-glucan branching enzyme